MIAWHKILEVSPYEPRALRELAQVAKSNEQHDRALDHYARPHLVLDSDAHSSHLASPTTLSIASCGHVRSRVPYQAPACCAARRGGRRLRVRWGRDNTDSRQRDTHRHTHTHTLHEQQVSMSLCMNSKCLCVLRVTLWSTRQRPTQPATRRPPLRKRGRGRGRHRETERETRRDERDRERAFITADGDVQRS